MLITGFRDFFRTTLPVLTLLLLFEIAARASRETTDLLNSLGLWVSAQESLSSIVAFAIVNLPLMLAERYWPGTNSKRNYPVGAKFWFVFLVITYGWSKIATLLMAKLGLVPVVLWNVQNDSGAVTHSFVIALGILVSIWAFDFFYYWFHRAQHHFEMLWRFHRIHHSIVHLNCLNSYHHVLEEMFRFPFITVPLAFLLKVDVPQLVLLSAFVATWGQYIHSDTRIHLGKLGPVFADNAYHRIHHSVLQHHFSKNFAAFFPVWDKIFGTHQERAREELPAVGLDDLPPSITVFDYLFMPFRKMQKRGGAS